VPTLVYRAAPAICATERLLREQGQESQSRSLTVKSPGCVSSGLSGWEGTFVAIPRETRALLGHNLGRRHRLEVIVQ
jgi:hypothetical protein